MRACATSSLRTDDRPRESEGIWAYQRVSVQGSAFFDFAGAKGRPRGGGQRYGSSEGADAGPSDTGPIGAPNDDDIPF